MLLTAQQNSSPKTNRPWTDGFEIIHSRACQNPKKAVEWLRNKDPMHCVVWAAEKTRRANTDDDSDDTGDSDEDQAANFDGSLPELEKDALRSLSLADVLTSNIEEQSVEHSTRANREVPRESTDEESVDDSDQDEMVAVLERALEQCSPMSLRYRQLSQMLQARLKEVQTAKGFEERMYQDRRQNLLSRGVTEEHVVLLSRHSSDPLPTPIQRDLDVASEKNWWPRESGRKRHLNHRGCKRPRGNYTNAALPFQQCWIEKQGRRWKHTDRCCKTNSRTIIKTWAP